MRRILVSLSLILLLLTGCSQKVEKKMPEEVAKEFLEAIYINKDLKAARLLSTQELSDLLYHYRSIAMIQRHILDFRLSTAEIFVRDVDADFFRRSEKDVEVELHIRGDFEGDRRADDLYLTVTKVGRHWRVKSIKRVSG